MKTAIRSILILAGFSLVTACTSSASQPREPGPPDQPTVLELELAPAPNAAVLKREWDVDIDYDSQDTQVVFDFYDTDLAQQGWTRVSLEREGGDYDANYRKDGLVLDLDVELDSGKVEVEIEIEETAPGISNYSLTSLPGLELKLVPGLR
ncbi:MAG: hypothetical protein M3498_04730, partial [Deinococcota bacterium]|nr:hypothetical protein [Deinococcota bacterium]MDQ3458602.1 hypothetical protein [Deinococcota bacterium]